MTLSSPLHIPQQPQDGYDFGSLVLAIRHQFKWLAITVVLFVAAAIAFVETRTPLYQSQSLILLSQSRTALDAERDPLQNSAQIEALVFGEMRYLSSDNFLLDLIRRAKLTSVAEFQAEGEIPSETDLLPVMRNRITLQSEGDSYVLSITIRSENPDFAADLANQAADLFVERSQQRGSRGAIDLAIRVAVQLRRHSIEVTQAEQKLDNLLLPILSKQSSNPVLRDRYLALLDESTALAQLEAQRLEETTKLTAETQFGSGVFAALGNIESRRLALFDEKREIWEKIAGARATRSVRTPEVFESFQTLDLTHQVYNRLLDRLVDLELEASLFVAGASLLAPALTPATPSFPKKKNTVVLALILSMALGLGLVIWREFFAGRLLRPSHLPATLDPKDQYFLSLPHRKMRAAIDRPHDSDLQRAMFDVDRMVGVLEHMGDQTDNFSLVTNVLQTGACDGFDYAIELVVRRLVAADRYVAVVDLRGGVATSGGWFESKVKQMRRLLPRGKALKLAKREDPVTGAQIYTVKQGMLDHDGWSTADMLGRLVPQLTNSFDDVILISPYTGPHGGNRPFLAQADAHILVSELQRTKIKSVKDASDWALAHNTRTPCLSLTVGSL